MLWSLSRTYRSEALPSFHYISWRASYVFTWTMPKCPYRDSTITHRTIYVPMCLLYACMSVFIYIHAYMSAYSACLLLLTCLLAQRPEKPAGLMWWEGMEQVFMCAWWCCKNESPWKTYRGGGVQEGGWVFPFGRSVGGTPTLCHSPLLHIQYSVRKHKHMHRQLFLDTQSRTVKNIFNLIMSHTHMQ